MDISKYRVGDIVAFHGDTPAENDRGTVVRYHSGHMAVAWTVAQEVHDEDPYDNRISLISRAAD